MTLTTRLSLFFLGALALVLLGFSATLYVLARTYLYRQADDRLEAALNTLVAAADVSAEGVEWEPHERRLSLGDETGDGPVLWMVTDPQGRRVDGSRGTADEDFLAGSKPDLSSNQPTKQVVQWRGQSWSVSRRQLQAPVRTPPAAHPLIKTADTGRTPPTPQRRRGESESEYPFLVITAGVSLQPVQTMLRTLALALAGTSVGIWLLALFLGRQLCRRALLPVARMAATARTMEACDLGQRLPNAGTGDELEDLSRAFNGLLDRVHESFERQQRFTGDASHQLQTPLTAMLGQVEVALRRDRAAEEYQRVLLSVQGQTQRLRQIVEMLLFLARADAEARLPHLEALNLTDWLKEHVRSWSAHPRAADLRLEFTSDGPVWVEVQPALVGQLLDNLLDNACKYSEPGTPITVRLGSEKGLVSLAVQDAGCGIDPEDLPHVFEPFYRSPRARQLERSGVGLGLAVTNRIATAFGGRIAVDSVPGRESCFTLWLPQATPTCS